MGTERARAQREAVANVAHETGQPETSGERIRNRALMRYLAAEFKRVTRRTPPASEPPASGE